MSRIKHSDKFCHFFLHCLPTFLIFMFVDFVRVGPSTRAVLRILNLTIFAEINLFLTFFYPLEIIVDSCRGDSGVTYFCSCDFYFCCCFCKFRVFCKHPSRIRTIFNCRHCVQSWTLLCNFSVDEVIEMFFVDRSYTIASLISLRPY